ncbi:MAG: hypothetical protein KC516_02395 [Nanoarchaeota archaeon]|nr:hypothetical protein [Nanoarchaeota archaeon]
MKSEIAKKPGIFYGEEALSMLRFRLTQKYEGNLTINGKKSKITDYGQCLSEIIEKKFPGGIEKLKYHEKYNSRKKERKIKVTLKKDKYNSLEAKSILN